MRTSHLSSASIRSGDLDPAHPIFRDPDLGEVLVVTSPAGRRRLAERLSLQEGCAVEATPGDAGPLESRDSVGRYEVYRIAARGGGAEATKGMIRGRSPQISIKAESETVRPDAQSRPAALGDGVCDGAISDQRRFEAAGRGPRAGPLQIKIVVIYRTINSGLDVVPPGDGGVPYSLMMRYLRLREGIR